MKKNNIISYQAYEYLKKIINLKKNIKGVIFDIIKSGCTGWKFSISFVQLNHNINNKEFLCIKQYDIFFYLRKEYKDTLMNTFIDIEEKKLKQYSIIFKNNKLKDYCGCGESFSIEKN